MRRGIKGVKGEITIKLKERMDAMEMLHKDKLSSVTQSRPTLCDPMDCSTPEFPVHYQLLELAQTHVH